MRFKKLWITIILICCSLFLFTSCKENSVVQSISLVGYSSESPLEFYVGEFSYGDYSVLITYDNGETKELTLTEDMIPETDKLKFYQDGKREITITYKGVTTVVAINVSRKQFSDNVKLKDFTATYEGKSFTVEVEGDLPGGTKILYPQGNTFQNAGSYDMTAILQCDGYVTKTLSAKVTIERATYDLSNAQLYSETVVYDKDAHSLVVKGKPIEDENGKVLHQTVSLPQGVSVSYTITKVKDGKGVSIPLEKQQVIDGNKAIDAGTYMVCAKFRGDISNYNSIPDSVAYLTVDRDSYDMSKIEFHDSQVEYSGEEHSLSIAEDSKLPLDVEISYQIRRIKDGAGNNVNSEFTEGNTATDAGIYLVKVVFNLVGKNADNYIASPLEKQAYLTILRAKYDDSMQDMYVDSRWYDFVEGETYEIYFDCELPEGVTPIFTLTNEKGETVEGQLEVITETVGGEETVVKTIYKYLFTAQNTGEYTCVITFEHGNANYEDIALKLETWVYISSSSV